MKRRYFLGLLVCGAAASIGTWVLVLRGDDERETLVLHLTEIFPELEPVCRLGRQAAASLRDETTEALLDELVSGVEWSDVTERNAASILRSRIRRDYAEANLVEVEGWKLARTEALFYALTSRLSCETDRSESAGS